MSLIPHKPPVPYLSILETTLGRKLVKVKIHYEDGTARAWKFSAKSRQWTKSARSVAECDLRKIRHEDRALVRRAQGIGEP